MVLYSDRVVASSAEYCLREETYITDKGDIVFYELNLSGRVYCIGEVLGRLLEEPFVIFQEEDMSDEDGLNLLAMYIELFTEQVLH